MTNDNHIKAAKRAAHLYHLGMAVSAKAKLLTMTPNQTRVVSIFLHEVKISHERARQEAGL